MVHLFLIRAKHKANVNVNACFFSARKNRPHNKANQIFPNKGMKILLFEHGRLGALRTCGINSDHETNRQNRLLTKRNVLLP